MLPMTPTGKKIKALSKTFPVLNGAIYRGSVIRSVGIVPHKFLTYSGQK